MDGVGYVQLVLDFAEEMNRLQRRCFPLLQEGNRAEVLERYRREANGIYARYLSRRRRTCYYGLATPPQFAAITNGCSCETLEETPRRVLVTVYTGEGRVDFQFRLVFQEENWRIDSYRQRYHSKDREKIQRWSYGSF